MFYDHQAAKTHPDPFAGREEVAGSKWVDRARKEILINTHAPSIQHLMVGLIPSTVCLRCDADDFRPCSSYVIMGFDKSRTRWSSP